MAAVLERDVLLFIALGFAFIAVLLVALMAARRHARSGTEPLFWFSDFDDPGD